MAEIIDIQYRLNGGPWISVGVVEGFQIPGLTNGQSYSVQIRAVTENGPGPSSTALYRMPHAPGGGLNPPEPFTSNMWSLTPHNGRATVSINSLPDSDAAINNIHYRVDGGIWNVANTTTDFDITGLTNHFTHQIQIRAFSTNGASAPSDVKSVTPVDAAEPPTPFTVGRWALVSDEERALVQINSLPPSTSPITNIEYKVDSSSWASANTTSSFYINGLTNEVEYAVQIRAVNIAGSSSASDTKTVTPHDILHYPAAFTNSQWGLVPGDTQVAITISSLPASENPIVDIEYNVDGGSWNSANTISNFNITGLTNGQQYGIRIRAVNGDGEGPQSNLKTITPIAAAAAPSAFSSGQWSVSVGTLNITININQLPNNNGSPITQLQYRLDGSDWVNMTGLTFHTISGLTDSQTYDVEIRALNSIGPSSVSDTKSFTAPVRTPSAFSSGQWSVTGVNTGLNIVIGTLPASPSPITGLEYRIDGGSWTPTGGIGNFSISGLVNGQEYTVELRCVNIFGFSSGSDTKSSTPVGARTYYVSLSGNNNNNGISANTAWANTTKVNSVAYLPGDTVLFEGGSEFVGNIILSSNNISSNVTHPVTFSSYGTGQARISNGNGNTSFNILNVGNVVIDNLQITGTDTKYGIRAVANNNTTLGTLSITNSAVFSTAQTAIDIVSTSANSRYSNVFVSNNQVYSATGIGLHVHGPFANARQINNLTIQYNNVYDCGEDGIVVSNSTTPKIQHNIVSNTGSSSSDNFGILVFQSSNGSISNNQVTKIKSTSLYSGGIAVHGASNNFIVEYNFTSQNEGPGISVLSYDGGGTSNVVVRYNISALDGSTVDSIGNPSGNGVVSAIFHNNTIYYDGLNAAPISFISPVNANTKIYNNIFMGSNNVPYIIQTSTVGNSLSFKGNLYWGAGNSNVRWGANTYTLDAWSTAFSQERDDTTVQYVNSDPLFASAGGTLPDNYKVSQISPALSGGINLLTSLGINPGNRDYFDTVSYGTRDIGAMNISSLDPNFKSSTTVSYGSRTNTSVNIPANIKNGDILVLFFVIRATGGTNPTFTPPAGWTNIPDGTSFIQEGVNGATQYIRYATYWKRASNETSPWQFVHNSFNTGAVCVAVSGGDFISDPVANVISSKQTNGDGGSSQNINVSGAAIGATKSVILLFDVTATNTARAYTPAGYTNLADVRIGSWYKVRTTSGNEGSLSYNSRNSSSSQPWAAIRLAIKK